MSNVPMDKCDYFDTNVDAVELSHEDDDEAIEYYLDEFDGDVFPESVTVYGWTRKDVSLNAAIILEQALESLDEEYRDPDGGPTEATPAMKAAAEKFAQVVVAEYGEPWACDRVAEAEYDIRTWCEKNRPDFLPMCQPAAGVEGK